MRNLAMAAGMIASLMALAACDEAMVTEGPVAYAPAAGGDTATRLQALGFVPAATTADGTPAALRYSGPVNAAVVCRRGAGSFAPIPAASATLDAYVILSGGRATSGLYALTLRNSAGQVEGIDFNIGETKSFSSGLACKAA